MMYLQITLKWLKEKTYTCIFLHTLHISNEENEGNDHAWNWVKDIVCFLYNFFNNFKI